MPVAIVLLSGGIDSATALYWALKQGYTVQAVTYNYRGRASREAEAARKIARHAGVGQREVELPFMQTAAGIMRENPSAFNGVNVPEGYVPTRNLVFYALGAYYAEVYGASCIVGGHLVTDSIEFPDATPGFFQGLEQLINSTRLGDASNGLNKARLLMPFLDKDKAEVVKMAYELGAPLELTWSCFYDLEEQCGRCGTCL